MEVLFNFISSGDNYANCVIWWNYCDDDNGRDDDVVSSPPFVGRPQSTPTAGRGGRDNEFNSLCRASPSSSLFLTVSFPGHGLLPDCLLASDHPTSSSSSPSKRKLCLLQRDKLSMIKSSLIWILNEICINFWGNPPVSSASLAAQIASTTPCVCGNNPRG